MITSAVERGARARIEDAAIDLMGKRGVAGTTTQDIAQRARCSQAAIYKYWESKEALAEERFVDALTLLIEDMRSRAAAYTSPSERTLGALLGLLQFAREHPSEYAFLFHVFHSDYARWLGSHPKPRDVVLKEIRTAMRAGEVAKGNAEMKTALLLGMTIRLAFFERQKLVGAGPSELDEGLRQAAAVVLEN